MLFHVVIESILLVFSLIVESFLLFVEILAVTFELLLFQAHLLSELLKHLNLLASLCCLECTCLMAGTAHHTQIIFSHLNLALQDVALAVIRIAIAITVIVIVVITEVVVQPWPSLSTLLGPLPMIGLPHSLLSDHVIVTLVVSSCRHLEYFLRLGLSHCLAFDG